MTEPPQTIELQIQQDEILEAEVILWRGMAPTADAKGYLEIEVYNLVTGVHEGRQVGARGPRILTGRMDSTGCVTLTFDQVHWCTFAEWQRCMQLLGHIYIRAFDLMGAEPDPQIDPGGAAVYRMALEARKEARVQAAIDQAVADIHAGARMPRA